MPNPVPVVLLGRLAVDVCTQGHGFGKWLLSDAIHRVANLAEQVGIKAVMVHAIDDDARVFMSILVLFSQLWHLIPCFIKFDVTQFYWA